MSTVATINSLKSAETKVYQRYQISARQLSEILDMYAAEIAEDYEKRNLKYPEQWYLLTGAVSMLQRYMTNVAHFDKTRNDVEWCGEPTPVDLNATLPFLAIPRPVFEEREDTGE